VKEVVAILKKEGSIDKYPLFKSIYNISFEGAPAESMLATLGCFELEQVLMAKDQFGKVVTKRTVVYYGRMGDQRSAL